MKRLIFQALGLSLVVGTAFFATALLGLNIYFIERLKPLFAPGTYLFNLIIPAGFQSTSDWILAIFLNCFVYFLFFLSVLLGLRRKG